MKMNLSRKLRSKGGFTLAELVIVIAIIAILAGIAFVYVNPNDISAVEYDRSAEAIATAVQNRLTELRNAGEMQFLRELGEPSGKSGEDVATLAAESTHGGYRYVFSFSLAADGTVTQNSKIGYILPPGSVDLELTDHYYAIGFQSDTGMVGEVYYSPEPFASTIDNLVNLKTHEDLRRTQKVGFYEGSWDSQEVAFANLPTPQLTITNYEELVLSIYLPEVKQLKDLGKEIGILISLTDEDGKAFGEKGMTLYDTAIYSTYSLGPGTAAAENTPVVQQTIASGAVYTIILDTVKPCTSGDMKATLADAANPAVANVNPPKGIFEDWARRSKACKEGVFKLGDNSVITVTVYCLYGKDDPNYSEDFPIDSTYMPRSASINFNGWFNKYGSSTAEIACGRHLQNLGKLTELREDLAPYLPTATKNPDGTYTYSDYNYGMADSYTDESSNAGTSYNDITKKYDYRSGVKTITKAKQIKMIDFDCAGWKDKDGNQILFTPVNLPPSFSYYGNYLTINHLKVDAPFYAGLFGYAYNENFYDVLLVNPSVNSQMPARLAELYEMGVGALIGTSRDSKRIYNCQVYLTQEDGIYDSAKYRVTGSCYVGGLIGFCEDERFSACSASVYTGYSEDDAKVSRFVGGLIGAITGDSTLEDCYAAGYLTGEYVGGLVGCVLADSDPSGDEYRISTCYTAGHIEYATKKASGLVGNIHELSGAARAAVSIYNNYCVVIYGVLKEGKYVWDDTIPIYGTFEGDGFEWLHTDAEYQYIKGHFAGDTFFAGSTFADENKNYYIPQEGITYSASEYFLAMRAVTEEIEEAIQSASDYTAISNALAKAKEQIFYLKKVQALEELKLAMQQILYEVDNETGKDKKGNPYNEAGCYNSDRDDYKFYLDVDGVHIYNDKGDFGEDSTALKNSLQLTLVQALHAIYNGTYTDDKGNTQTVTIAGSDCSKKVTGLNDYTFMGIYAFLKEQYEDLLNYLDKGETAKADEVKKTLKQILGDDCQDGEVKESWEATNSEGKPYTYYYYYDGLFYHCFYQNMLYELFDRAKDYYQTTIGDKNGELIYRHFRSDLCESMFRELLDDLGMSIKGHQKLLYNGKQEAVDDMLKELKGYLDVVDCWSGDMKSKNQDVKDLINAAILQLEGGTKTIDGKSVTVNVKDCFKTAVGQYDVGTLELKNAVTEAYNKLNAIYNYFNDSAIKDVVDVIDDEMVEDDSGKMVYPTGKMKDAFRDPVKSIRDEVELCGKAVANSGVEGAIDDFIIRKDVTGANLTTLKTEFVAKLQIYRAAEWENTDSGYRIYNKTQLRNAARGYLHGRTTETRGSSLGFMYNYCNQANPYYPDYDPEGGNPNLYVDEGEKHQIYNNVFPYEEKKGLTDYYPFPFVDGRNTRDITTGEDSSYRATFILFHYGDWLTDDLWATPESYSLNEAIELMNKIKNELTAVKNDTAHKDITGNIINNMDALIISINECVNSLGGKTTKDALTAVHTAISGWIAEEGTFTAISGTHAKTIRKAISADVRAKLERYKQELIALEDRLSTVSGKA